VLADRLRPVPVVRLAHHADTIDSDLDWLALARAGSYRVADTMPP
jgi:hypothetical protein